MRGVSICPKECCRICAWFLKKNSVGKGVRPDEGQSSNSHHRHRLGYRLFLLFLDHPFHPFGLGF